MSKLKIEKHLDHTTLTVKLHGIIDEDANFKNINETKASLIVMDFSGISMINSCGIREWINFISQLSVQSKMIYQNCPQIIIEQINMVHGFFRPGSVIESFYAPYFCESCDTESKILLKSEEVKSQEAPQVKCPNCGASPMEFDAIEAQYFNFLKNRN